jgi:membrane protease YdiL (CAAX protease family)
MSPDALQLLLNLIVVLALTACLGIWGWVVARWLLGLPVIPYQSRRPVPWRSIDVLLVVIFFVVTPTIVLHESRVLLNNGPDVSKIETAKDAPLDTDHPLHRVLMEGHKTWPVVVCVLLAIVVAPITEELVFRLVLQGWFEAAERRMRRQMPWLRRIVAGLVPVLTVALLFAAIHYRKPGPRQDLPQLVFQLQFALVASLATIAFAVCWLKFAAGATLADFGIVPSKIGSDIRLGLITFFAVTPPVYAVAIAAKSLLPNVPVTDPFPIFFLAIALGTLYYRTHRVVPSLVLHMAFNTLGVLGAIGASQ